MKSARAAATSQWSAGCSPTTAASAAPRKADRPAEVLEAPATECFGALEEGARLAQVLTSEPGEPWQERLAIARSRLDALSPPRRREERAQARRQARALSPMPNVQRLNVRHAASSPRRHSSRRHAARRVRRRCFERSFSYEPIGCFGVLLFLQLALAAAPAGV